MIGQLVDGKYEIIAVLGSGAMGAVYEARNIATGRSVAIKVIASGLGTDPALVVRFQREARAAGAIESTHIAQVLDAGQDRTTAAPYLVMELLKGEDLDTLTRRLGAVRCGLALRIIAQALAGLEKAHGVGVVHRDIKPANLFIAVGDAGHRVVKLVDFGIAKVKDELAASNHALTQTSALLGSPLYMSPEQAKASKKVDARADLWSLGVVLYQLLSGKAPHAHAESLTELLLAICTENATPVQQVAPWVPANVAEIVERAIRLDPAKRFDSAKQMRDAIAAIVPDWNVLSETMLTPLTEEERAFVAEPTAELALGVSTGPARDDPRTASGASAGNSALALGGATNLLPLEQSASQHSAPALAKSAGAGAGSGLGADSLAGTTARRGARIIPVAIAAVALVLSLGFVGIRTLRSPGSGATSSGMVATPPSASPTPWPSAAIDEPARSASPVTGAASPSASTSAAASAASSAPATPPPATGPARVRPTTTTAGATAATGALTPATPAAPATTPRPPASPPTPTAKPTTPAATSSSPISREFN